MSLPFLFVLTVTCNNVFYLFHRFPELKQTELTVIHQGLLENLQLPIVHNVDCTKMLQLKLAIYYYIAITAYSSYYSHYSYVLNYAHQINYWISIYIHEVSVQLHLLTLGYLNVMSVNVDIVTLLQLLQRLCEENHISCRLQLKGFLIYTC